MSQQDKITDRAIAFRRAVFDEVRCWKVVGGDREAYAIRWGETPGPEMPGADVITMSMEHYRMPNESAAHEFVQFVAFEKAIAALLGEAHTSKG